MGTGKIKLGEEELHYCVQEYGSTTFFRMRPIKRKKYWLWGELIDDIKYTRLFNVEFDVESPYYSKSQVKNSLEKAYSAILRGEEIAKGEII